ncbi:MAG: apolipoprotein N-acyltransferase [Elusimicrobiota bacterium]
MPRGGFARLSAASLGAALAACALPAPGLWALAWVGLAPLIVSANSAPTRREAAAAGFVAGLAYHGVALHWIYQTCLFARIPFPVAGLAWAALSCALALNWALVALLTRGLAAEGSSAARPWLWALSWTAVAFLSERLTPRLAADLLGYTQWPNLALIQAGSWGGPHLLGFVVVLVNAALAEAWLGVREGLTGAAATVSAALALAGGLWVHGVSTLLQRPADMGESARVEILQPCVDQYHKWDQDFLKEVLGGYNDLLARPRLKSPSLVVWPETSIPFWVARSSAVPEARRWALEMKSPQLVGIVARPDRGEGASNSAQLIAPDGNVDGFYAKRQLVPFGEFVPLRGLIPRFVIENWLVLLDQLGDLAPGAARQPLLTTAWGRTAVTICYEAMFPRWARLDASRGASLLINITNDGWYKNTWGPHQHYRANQFRAVENRITVIRAGNTGISAVIDPWGMETAKLDLDVRGRLDAEVPLTDRFPRRSFYVRNGDWFAAACLAIILAALLRKGLR